MPQRLVDARAKPSGIAVWDIARIEAGRPEWGIDMDDTTTMLLEHVSRQVAYRPLSVLRGWQPPQGEMRDSIPAPVTD